MNNRFLKILSLLTALCVVISLASCKGKTEAPMQNVEPTYEKSVTEKTVKIANIPTDSNGLTDMLNAAVNYVDKYCYKYKKALKCEASIDSLGSLSSASNAAEAFASAAFPCYANI